MPQFYYTAISQSGERKSGTQEAVDSSDLAKSLRDEGFILTSAKEERQYGQSKNSFKKILVSVSFLNRVPLVEKMLFARHLSVMVKAGFSLNKALQVLVLQTKHQRFARLIDELEQEVRKGTAFGDALAKYPDVFPDLFVNMVKVGEATGNLEENLKLLAVQMKKDHDLRSKIKSAMMYPSVILLAMIGIGIGMMVFVMPKLIAVFEELNVELPATTLFIVNLSKFLTGNWILVLIAVIGLVIGARFAGRTKQGKNLFDRLVLKAPIFGGISRKINAARMARTLSSLVESGVSIVRALEITAGTLSNSLFYFAIIDASKKVQKGETLSRSLTAYPDLFLPIVTQMVQVGEETGTLGEITKKLAEFYEEEVANVTKGLSTIIEPILMVIIGAAVGFFAISMIQPMYSMMNTL